ncbi:MAG: response regulator [Candidatus Woesebacteria bacterium]|nr:MAG: response regulator [Candidatus Woesebacteria bacterium]
MKKILVVEDDKFLANAYRVKLTKAQFETRLASDGNEALSALDEFNPDLVILDLMMPVKDGFSVLSEMRKSDKWKSTPIIVSSNLGQKEDIDRALGLGANDYVVKSDLSMAELLEKVNKLIK